MTDTMLLWLGMLSACIVTPLALLYFGWRFQKKPPAKINRRYGYRSKRSMLNQDTWQYAHKCCGELWSSMGQWLMPLTLVALIASYWGGEPVILLVAGLLIVLDLGVAFWTFYKVEGELKAVFDEAGQRKL